MAWIGETRDDELQLQYSKQCRREGAKYSTTTKAICRCRIWGISNQHHDLADKAAGAAFSIIVTAVAMVVVAIVGAEGGSKVK
jgi:hypothetical protein